MPSPSNLPPGLPGGSSACDVEIVCEVCSFVFTVPGTVEADTNATDIDADADLTCPSCGHVDGAVKPSAAVGPDLPWLETEPGLSVAGVLRKAFHAHGVELSADKAEEEHRWAHFDRARVPS